MPHIGSYIKAQYKRRETFSEVYSITRCHQHDQGGKKSTPQSDLWHRALKWCLFTSNQTNSLRNLTLLGAFTRSFSFIHPWLTLKSCIVEMRKRCKNKDLHRNKWKIPESRGKQCGIYPYFSESCNLIDNFTSIEIKLGFDSFVWKTNNWWHIKMRSV